MRTVYIVLRDHGTIVRAFLSNDKAEQWASEQGRLNQRAWFYVDEIELDDEE
jgi:hypothetical protein